MKSCSARALVGATVVALALAIAPPASATNIGTEGCTPGYWKNHTDNWEEYTTGSLVKYQWADGFAGAPAAVQAYREKTFIEALSLRGGRGLGGATEILLRAATAAYLNAAHEGVAYPYRRFGQPGELKAQVNAALASGSRQQMLDLAATLDAANNLGCPLS